MDLSRRVYARPALTPSFRNGRDAPAGCHWSSSTALVCEPVRFIVTSVFANGCTFAAAYFDPSAFRSADHDPVLIGLDLGASSHRGQ